VVHGFDHQRIVGRAPQPELDKLERTVRYPTLSKRLHLLSPTLPWNGSIKLGLSESRMFGYACA
jgi:hypothetical protein